MSPSKSAIPLSTRRIGRVVGSPLLPIKVNGVLAPKTILDTGAVLTVLRVGLLPPANVSTFLNLQDFNGGISSVNGPREVVFTFAGLKMTFSVYESSTMAEDCIIGTDMVFHFDIATRLAANSITVHRDDRGVLEKPTELPVQLEHEDTPSLFAVGRVFFKVGACQSVALQPVSRQAVQLHVITTDSMTRTTAKGDTKTGAPANQIRHPRNTPAPPVSSHCGAAEVIEERSQTNLVGLNRPSAHHKMRGAHLDLSSLSQEGDERLKVTLNQAQDQAAHGQDSPASNAPAYAQTSYGLLKLTNQSVEVAVGTQLIQINGQSTPQVILVNESVDYIQVPKKALNGRIYLQHQKAATALVRCFKASVTPVDHFDAEIDTIPLKPPIPKDQPLPDRLEALAGRCEGLSPLQQDLVRDQIRYNHDVFVEDDDDFGCCPWINSKSTLETLAIPTRTT